MTKCYGCKRGDLTEEDFHVAGKRGKRQVHSHCRACRASRFAEKKYSGYRCPTCANFCRPDSNGVCQKCNEVQGLRQCRSCGLLLPALLSYWGHKRRCNSCVSTARRLSGERRLADARERRQVHLFKRNRNRT